MDDVPVLVYDGDCGFCTACARWIAARWHGGARIAASQELGPSGLATLGLDEQAAAAAAWWVEPTGRRAGGALAVGEALRAARPPARWLGTAAVHAPGRWVGAALYALVARWRHLLPGATPQCRTAGAGRISGPAGTRGSA